MIGRAMGYNVRIVMPRNVYPEIPRALAVYGADVHWVTTDEGVTGAMSVARKMADDTAASCSTSSATRKRPRTLHVSRPGDPRRRAPGGCLRRGFLHGVKGVKVIEALRYPDR